MLILCFVTELYIRKGGAILIVPREVASKLTDEEYEEMTEDFNNELDKYIKSMTEEYVAYYLYLGYKLSAIAENKLNTIAYSAADSLSGTVNRLYDLNEIKKILETKYKLRVVDDETTTIEEIDLDG